MKSWLKWYSIGPLPNFVHVYSQAESAINLVIPGYWCTAMVPWCIHGNNVHGKVARSCPKNIVMLRSRRTRIVILIFKEVQSRGASGTQQSTSSCSAWPVLACPCRGSVVELSHYCGSAIQIAANTVSFSLASRSFSPLSL